LIMFNPAKSLLRSPELAVAQRDSNLLTGLCHDGRAMVRTAA
jgi:hypothetical protein